MLRLKNRLGLRSDLFLEQFTETVFDPHNRFALVRLKMDENPDQTCPFLAKTGCTVYSDRPAACRLYPLGRATTWLRKSADDRDKFFVVRESHCLGFEANREWTVQEWLCHEGIKEYNAKNDLWMDIVTSDQRPWGQRDVSKEASDVFHGFLQSGPLQRLFIWKPGSLRSSMCHNRMIRQLAEDDTALMTFGFQVVEVQPLRRPDAAPQSLISPRLSRGDP